jgi:hypothetical protein
MKRSSATYNNDVDTSHLIDELQPIRKQDSPARLNLILLEQLRPLIFTAEVLKFKGSEDALGIVHDLWVIRRPVIEVTKNLHSFAIPAFAA